MATEKPAHVIRKRPPDLETGFELSRNLDGIRVGGGIEQRLGSRAYVKGEYRYSNYEAGAWKQEGLVGLGLRF